jgi:cysteine desulfurase
MRPVYLDNNATTRPDREVVEAMLPYLTEFYGNPSSTHDLGAASRQALKRARESIAALIGAAGGDEIVLTSGGTEADNLALRAGLAAFEDRDELIVSAVEHPAVLALARRLGKSRRLRVHVIPVDAQGRLDLAALRAVLSPRVALVSLMWANNETGVIFPVEEIAAEVKAVGALMHVDAVQAAGRVVIDLARSPIDLLSLSAHKLHGPKGAGALFVRRGLSLQPLLTGGSQERGRRAGTENVPGAVGFGKAAELAALRVRGDACRMAALRDRLELSLQQRIAGVTVVGAGAPRLPNTSALVCAGAEADGLAALLNRAGIAVSTGAACAAGSHRPSHVLHAMDARLSEFGATRFSLSRDSDDEDIDRVLNTLPALVARLRGDAPAPSPVELAA